MSRRNDGGPAFPRPASEYTKFGTCPDGNDAERAFDGMTLRDYFAAKAMQAFIARGVINGMEDDEYDAMISQWSYFMAGAMLEARKAGD